MNLKNLISNIAAVLYFISLYGYSFSQDRLPGLFINEFMAANASTILSADYQEYADWLEIYNATDTRVDIGGYFLSDDAKNPLKWRIPTGTALAAGGIVLFWADGRDKGLHTSFNLAKSGEWIGFYNYEGKLIDSLRFGEQVDDISFGRFPDGGENWRFFDLPTPGSANVNPGYEGIVQPPQFYPAGGFYDGSRPVELRAEHPDDTIRYTLDGSLPGPASAIYTSSIILHETTVIRAQTVRPGRMPSRVITHTYLIDEQTRLPVVAIATDPANFWDDEIGIYVEGTNGIPGYCTTERRNWNRPWERPISLEMFEADRTLGFKIDAGVQIGGGCSRLYPQKSLAVYARSKYGAGKINYRIFADKEIDSFNNILLRNSGQDWWRAMMRDGMMHTLVKDHMDIDRVAYKPAVLFLNGEYWGIHAIREKHNEHYLESNYGIDAKKIDILFGNASVKQGSAKRYKDMIDFINAHDMTVAANYQWVATQMDINEYLDYTIAEIYFANSDWPGGNIKYWRPHGENSKWRWILFDTDLGFGAHSRGQYDSNTLANATAATASYYANPPWSTLLLRKLLDNTEFRNQFIQRFAAHLNVTFHPQRVIGIIDSLKTNIEAEIPRHLRKWEKSTSFNSGWHYHLDVMREFAGKRPEQVIRHLVGKFGLSGSARLTVQGPDAEMGAVFVYGVKLPAADLNGQFLKDVPIRCKAVANRGFRFVRWQGLANSSDDSVEVVLTGDGGLQALFEKDESTVFGGLYINEILAINDRTKVDEFGDYDDWFELYNSSREAVDIGGLYVTDDLRRPDRRQIPTSFPELTTIPPGGFLLLWADGDTAQGALHVDFKLSGDGEAVGLAQRTEGGFVFIDTVVFGRQTADVSYGRFPDGGVSFQYMTTPTPGYANISTGIATAAINRPASCRLEQNYPNPFNSLTVIGYRSRVDGRVKLTVYDVAGRRVATLIDRRQSAGAHSVVFHAHDLAGGVYFIRLETKSFVQTRKMILLR